MFGYDSSDDDDLDPDGEGDTRMYFGRLMPKEWQFLYDWFDTVSERLGIAERQRLDSHAVELGRDLENDVWIKVDHDSGMVSKYDDLADDPVKCQSTLREMLILTTILAEVRYDVWYGELRRAARFMAPKFLDLKHHKLERKYSFMFYNSENPAEYSWRSLQNLFGHDKFSDEFKTQFALASEIAKEQGFDVRTMAPIPIKFIVRPRRTDKRSDQVLILKNLTKTVLKILELEAKHSAAVSKTTSTTTEVAAPAAPAAPAATASTRRSGRMKAMKKGKSAAAAAPMPPIPVFHLECMDLDFRKFSYHTTVLAEIQKLVETGVPIKSLTLPMCGTKYGKESQEKERLVWASLLCAITGQPQGDATAKQLVRVDRVVLPSICPMDVYAVMLCSTLATARGVTSVRFEQDLLDRKYGGTKKWGIWTWLAYALFSSASSQSSIKMLEFKGFRLTRTGMDAFAETVQSQDPLATLWQLSTMRLDDSSTTATASSVYSTGRKVSVAKGTVVTPLGVMHGSTVTLPSEWRGTLVYEDSSSSTTVDVLLPGFGLCRVDRASLPNKRQRTTESSASSSSSSLPSSFASSDAAPAGSKHATTTVTQLVLGLRSNAKLNAMISMRTGRPVQDSFETKPFVSDLLGLVGAPLTALSLQADDADEACVDECLSHCPKLRSLRLGGVSLATMDPLIRAYTERHTKIESLELRDIKELSADEFEKFLSHCETESGCDPIQTNLRKLRFGKGWSSCFRKETTEMMENILASQGRRLSYVHTFSNCEGHGPRASFQLREEFRGETVEDKPLDVARRAAFLSVVRRQQRPPLSQESITTIFEFAAPATSRIVLDELDFTRTYYDSDEFDED